MRRALSTAALALGALTLAPAAQAASPTEGGCAQFGENVAGLAASLGPVFGATASGVASSGPAAFPAAVVHLEQNDLCG